MGLGVGVGGWGWGWCGGRAGVNVVVSIDAFQTLYTGKSSSHEKQSNIPSSPHLTISPLPHITYEELAE